MGTTTEELRTAHRAWYDRDRSVPNNLDGNLPCIACECGGNCECGHSPLGAPEHLCELDVNDQGESHRCYCCRAMGLEPKET